MRYRRTHHSGIVGNRIKRTGGRWSQSDRCAAFAIHVVPRSRHVCCHGGKPRRQMATLVWRTLCGCTPCTHKTFPRYAIIELERICQWYKVTPPKLYNKNGVRTFSSRRMGSGRSRMGGRMAQRMETWLLRDGSFRVYATNPVGRRKGRIIELEVVATGERFHGSARKMRRLVQVLEGSNPEPPVPQPWIRRGIRRDPV